MSNGIAGLEENFNELVSDAEFYMEHNLPFSAHLPNYAGRMITSGFFREHENRPNFPYTTFSYNVFSSAKEKALRAAKECEEYPEMFQHLAELKDYVAVHLTDFLPDGGIIKTRNTIMPHLSLRNTIHFSINHAVTGHAYGDWSNKSIAVLAPLKGLYEKVNEAALGKHPYFRIENFNVVDTYTLGDAILPEGSTVVINANAYDQAIKGGILKTADLSLFLNDQYTATTSEMPKFIEIKKDGINYAVYNPFETNIGANATEQLEKMGFENFPGNMWNWNGAGGIAGQERVAHELGSKLEVHFHTDLHKMERLSHELSDMCFGDLSKNPARKDVDALIDYFNKESYTGFNEQEKRGSEHLGRVNDLIGLIEGQKSQYNSEFQQRIDQFLESNKAELKHSLPQELISMYNMQLE